METLATWHLKSGWLTWVNIKTLTQKIFAVCDLETSYPDQWGCRKMIFTSNFVKIWPLSWFNTYLGTKALVNIPFLPVLTWWAFPISEDHSCRKSVNAFRRNRSRDRQTGEMPNRPIQTGPRFARIYFWFMRRAFPFLTALTNFASWQANEIRARNATSRASRPRFAPAGAATTSRSCTQSTGNERAALWRHFLQTPTLREHSFLWLSSYFGHW